MSEPLQTTPLSIGDKTLLEKFHEDVARQSDLMDDLAKQLITIELAIPGLYAAVLKLLSGDSATLETGPLFWLTLGCWFFALMLSLLSLIPRFYIVDPQVLEGNNSHSGAIGVKDYFIQSARYKRRLLIGSSVFFYFGICTAIIALT